MKKSLGLLVIVFLMVANIGWGQNKLLDKKTAESFERYVASSRKSDGDYSTISLANWRRDLDAPPMSGEDMVRKILCTFEAHYKNLKIIDYLIVYDDKPGKGLVYDFIIIRHETKPARTYQFATKQAVVEK